MSGRVALVTGATSGHGRAVARALAERGAEVILLGRSQERCDAVKREIASRTGREPRAVLCDLSSLQEVSRAAAEIEGPLHLLCNNAGLVNLHRTETADGLETTFAVNYLAHFKLTLLLLDRLEESARRLGRSSRIVNVSSDMHLMYTLDLDDLQSRVRYSWARSYGRSKLAIVYSTLELSRRLRSRGAPVTVNAVDPGPLESRIGSNHEGPIPRLVALMMKLFFPSAERAARTALQLCCDDELERVSGCYFRFGRQKLPRVDRSEPALGAKLWSISERLANI